LALLSPQPMAIRFPGKEELSKGVTSDYIF